MMYIFEKKKLDQILSDWNQIYEVHVPQKVENYSQFLLYHESASINLEDPHNTRYPPKSLFLPQSEVMLKFNRQLGQFENAIPDQKPRIVFGMRPCDAQALTLLDTVFDTEDNRDPYWKSRRDSTIIVGLGCPEPPQTCFCTTVGGGPFNHDGMDALLTQSDTHFFVEVLTEKGASLFSGFQKATPQQKDQVHQLQKDAHKNMTLAFETMGLKESLDQLFQSSYWEVIAESCLGCGVCTFLCPTCFCFDMVDEAQRNQRVRNWDTCMFRIYSLEASGHNPRPSRKERTRQRLMHKYSYWLEHINEIGCTGCGRCVRYCPVGLDIRKMLRLAAAFEGEVVHA
ncbi:MAG: 4Fe-4S dicluster domain-containing protein [Brevefilum sp.]|jgi:sulfhydrogenase subunit beta (sulfur reductase)